MRAELRIGEVAKLLGVTPKTLRHYQKVGLLAEPDRTDAGYRLYTARDLVRLLRIRRLQALGLSLAQIRRILGEPDDEHSLREVLHRLLDDYTAQIQELEARRQRIQRLLAEERLDTLDQPAGPPAILQWAQRELAEHATQVSDDVWAADARIFGALESLHWPEGYDLPLREAMAQFVQPGDQRYQQVLAFGERIAALAAVPEDAPEVERLAEEFRRSGAAEMIRSLLPPDAGSLDGVFGEVMAEVMVSALSPAQRRFLSLLQHQAGEQRDSDG